MGASRGGAIASLLSVRLKDSGAASEENLFTYTFESPAVVNGGTASSAGANIHNYYTGDDMVTFVPPWGMTVYGNRYDLNTDEINAHLPEELSKIGSDLSQAAANANPENTIGMIGSILSVLDSRRGKGQHAAKQAAEHTACAPVALVEQRQQEAEEIRVRPVRRSAVTEERIRLIGQRKNHIGFVFSGIFILIHHGYAVEQMPCIYHDRRDHRCKDGRSSCEESDAHVLHRACVDKEAHGCRPQDPVSGIAQEDAKTCAEDQISGHDRDRFIKSCFYCLYLHKFFIPVPLARLESIPTLLLYRHKILVIKYSRESKGILKI